jgi:hypothetical protein
LLGFLVILGLPCGRTLNGPYGGPQAAQIRVWQRCNWDRGRYSPREFARTGLALRRRRFIPIPRGFSEC